MRTSSQPQFFILNQLEMSLYLCIWMQLCLRQHNLISILKRYARPKSDIHRASVTDKKNHAKYVYQFVKRVEKLQKAYDWMDDLIHIFFSKISLIKSFRTSLKTIFFALIAPPMPITHRNATWLILQNFSDNKKKYVTVCYDALLINSLTFKNVP